MSFSRPLRSRRYHAFAVVAFAALLLIVLVMPGQASRAGVDVRTWKVTWTNIATGSQPLTPPLLVTHTNQIELWGVGQIASAGLADLAQDPNAGPLKSMLADNEDVYQTVIGAGPTPPGMSKSVTIQSSGDFNRLSFLSMLANTNDTFTGLAGVKLDNMTIDVYAYDAGTETNNELKASIPGPCCGHPFAMAESGQLIHLQQAGGIQGVGDLSPATYGWTGAVARITIEEVS